MTSGKIRYIYRFLTDTCVNLWGGNRPARNNLKELKMTGQLSSETGPWIEASAGLSIGTLAVRCAERFVAGLVRSVPVSGA